MLGRLIRKLVLATSVLVAIILGLLVWRTQHNDLLIARAKASNYNEVRLGEGQFAITLMTQWPPDDEQFGWGRPAETWVPKGVIGYYRRRGQLGRGLRMLDGAVVRLEPGTSPAWWSPIARTDGRALVDVPTPRHVHPLSSASRPTTTLSFPTSGPFVPPPDLATMKITVPSPSFSLGGSPGDGTATKLLSSPEFSRTEALALRVPPKFTPKPAPSFGFTSSPYWTPPIYRYERYGVRAWIVILLVLLPLWWSLLRVIVRWRQWNIRRRRGLCEQCGYDLRGNPAANACPECGTPMNDGAKAGEALVSTSTA